MKGIQKINLLKIFIMEDFYMFTIEMTAVQLAAQWLLTTVGMGAVIAWCVFGLVKLLKKSNKEEQ